LQRKAGSDNLGSIPVTVQPEKPTIHLNLLDFCRPKADSVMGRHSSNGWRRTMNSRDLKDVTTFI